MKERRKMTGGRKEGRKEGRKMKGGRKGRHPEWRGATSRGGDLEGRKG